MSAFLTIVSHNKAQKFFQVSHIFNSVQSQLKKGTAGLGLLGIGL